MQNHVIDRHDRLILDHLQKDAGLSAADLAQRIGLSTNACWRRVQRLTDAGIITKKVAVLSAEKINLAVTVFVQIKTRQHSKEWFERFKHVVDQIPEVIEFYRMSGAVDYMLKIKVPNIKAYDAVYQKLIEAIELEDVSAYFAMEEVKCTSSLPLKYCSQK